MTRSKSNTVRSVRSGARTTVSGVGISRMLEELVAAVRASDDIKGRMRQITLHDKQTTQIVGYGNQFQFQQLLSSSGFLRLAEHSCIHFIPAFWVIFSSNLEGSCLFPWNPLNRCLERKAFHVCAFGKLCCSLSIFAACIHASSGQLVHQDTGQAWVNATTLCACSF